MKGQNRLIKHYQILSEPGRGWGLSIIDYAAMGVNSATGKKGAQMDYFAFPIDEIKKS